MIWILMLVTSLAALAGGLVYISKRLARLSPIEKVSSKAKVRRLTAFLLLLFIEAGLCFGLSWYDAIIGTLFLFGIWLLCDLAGKIINCIRGKKPAHYVAGYFALGLTAVVLVWGYFSAMNVKETYYSFTSPKAGGEKLRIVQISDSHMGTTFDGKEFGRYTDQVNSLKPDLVVITGDFIDDDTSYEEMVEACANLGTLQATYGTCFVFGNHDRGYYASKRGYHEEELVAELEKNGVVILQDESLLIGDHYILGGREDASRKNRMGAADFAGTMEEAKYRIVLDHQPHDYDIQAQEGVNLVLSGHTHGGQFWPIIKLGEFFGLNDMTYGHRRVEDTDFVVSSGIADWAFHFKVGCISEIVIIDIE